jgi:hypothetical protein
MITNKVVWINHWKTNTQCGIELNALYIPHSCCFLMFSSFSTHFISYSMNHIVFCSFYICIFQFYKNTTARCILEQPTNIMEMQWIFNCMHYHALHSSFSQNDSQSPRLRWNKLDEICIILIICDFPFSFAFSLII